MKKILFILTLFTASVLSAGIYKNLNYEDVIYDDELSLKDLTTRTFENDDLSGKVIYGSTFYRETPNSIIFNNKMTGVTFINCNLDNIVIPEGNTLIDCTTRTIKVQNDCEDWFVDSKTLQPKEPVSKEEFKKLGISVNPVDIPQEKLKEPITTQVREGRLTPVAETPIVEPIEETP